MSTEPFVTGLAHVGLRVHDLQRSRAFYELLGFRFVIGPIGPEPVAILEHPSGIELNLILNAPGADDPNILMDVPEKHAGYTHIAMAVRDLEQARQHMEAAGVAISGGPIEFPTGARAVFVRDPDRNVIELHQPKQR
jgi:lactoylglutathione lyase